MATANLHMGYVGSVTIDGTPYFMTGSSLNPTQAPEVPDLVAGSIMRRGWVYGKVDPTGNVTGPLHEGATSLWATAFNRTIDYDHLANTVEIELYFYKGGGWKFSECVINDLNITATAGELVTFTADFAGRNPTQCSGTSSTEISCSKLMTWDRVLFSVAGVGGDRLANIQSVNFTLNNNVQKLFAIQGGSVDDHDLYPVDLPCGVREITGSISAYSNGPICDFLDDDIGADKWSDYTYSSAAKTIDFQVNPIIEVSFDAVFSRPEGSAQTGPAIYTLNFTAICEPNGTTA